MNVAPFWKIKEFSSLVGKHFTTVNTWFKALEEERIHYIQRTEADNEKIYDETDLNIAQYIVQKRDEGWSINGIHDALKGGAVTIREFPPDYHSENTDLTAASVEYIKDMLMKELKQALNDEMAIQIKHIQEDSKAMLLEQRQKELTADITKRRIEAKLRIEALKEWEKRPLTERFVKTGLFSKAENLAKRDIFIEEYILNHHAEATKKEYENEQ
ncbi:hypothetical protein M5X06_22240 [Paenibacillus alvei]|uniref:MerR family transcriptional regulator n=1 Tax=Paenibacillus alvei TaxID=44250 RepID=A0ABT4H2J5_PAEAL|nr:hypothetical protein [Paenibacillus alvei]MCY9763201.1 hypothetical protein [Paenibacillus alvei]MCY9769510.1 hypothetical protein [Paenibacillus alvei]